MADLVYRSLLKRDGKTLFANRPNTSAAQVVAFVGVAILAGLVIGLASALLPAWLVISALVLPAFAMVLIARPEYALVACVGLTCGLVHPALVPRLPFAGGVLVASDLTLVLLGIYSLISLGANSSSTVPGVRKAGPGMWFLLSLLSLFFGTSVVFAIFLNGIPAKDALGEARDFSYLLLCLPIAAVVLKDPVRQRRFVNGFVVLGCLFALGQIVQGLLDIPVFGQSGRLEALETLGRTEFGATRSLTRGISVIIMALFLVVGFFVMGRLRLVAFIGISALLMAGILLTFGRTTIVVVALGLIMLVGALRANRLPVLLVTLVVTIGVSISVLAAFKPKTVEQFLVRMTSINDELRFGYSANWRYEEARLIVPRIIEHPLEGLGLGARYKGFAGSASNPDLDRYIHNGYLYLAGKMGLPALAVFLALTAVVFRLGWAIRHAGIEPWRRIVGVVCAVMMVRFWLASFTEPHFMSDYSLVVIAICGALAWLVAGRTSAAVGKSSASPAHGNPGRVRSWKTVERSTSQ